MTDNDFGDNYEIVWGDDQGSIERLTAEVRNYTLDGAQYRRIPVLRDDAKIRGYNMRFIVCDYDGDEPSIIVSDEFLALPQNMQSAAIWHEVGHVHHEHNFRFSQTDAHAHRRERIALIRDGRVQQLELEADCFAVKMAGSAAIIAFLQRLLDTRPKGESGGVNDLGRIELELRIVEIKAIEQD